MNLPRRTQVQLELPSFHKMHFGEVMNKVASFAAVVALLGLGVYFYSAQPKGASLDNATPAGLSSAEGGSCCSQSSESMVAAAGSCCSNGATEMVSTGGESCCANKTEACCSEGSELVKTEAGSCCSEKTEACCSEGAEVVAVNAEAKTCACQGEKTETVSAGSEKAECHGDCENGCCQENKAEGEVAKTEGGEGK